MPKGPVIEPEHERFAIAALCAWLVFGIIGVLVVIGGGGFALIKLALWIWGFV